MHVLWPVVADWTVLYQSTINNMKLCMIRVSKCLISLLFMFPNFYRVNINSNPLCSTHLFTVYTSNTDVSMFSPHRSPECPIMWHHQQAMPWLPCLCAALHALAWTNAMVVCVCARSLFTVRNWDQQRLIYVGGGQPELSHQSSSCYVIVLRHGMAKKAFWGRVKSFWNERLRLDDWLVRSIAEL